MKQFDVFENPIAAARASYPLVVVLQSDAFGSAGRERVIAPLVSAAALTPPKARVLPLVVVDDARYVVVVPSLGSFPIAQLTHRVGSLADRRDALLGAIDELFFGS